MHPLETLFQPFSDHPRLHAQAKTRGGAEGSVVRSRVPQEPKNTSNTCSHVEGTVVSGGAGCVFRVLHVPVEGASIV